MSEISSSLAAIFAPEGALALNIPNFRARPQQLHMAERIAAAIKNQRTLIAEAGTGTGKTFAYLVPALLFGGKVIVSTGTKTLQDQLFQKDLPLVVRALKAPVQTALLKGRANYLCPYHLRRAATENRFQSREDAALFKKIARFARFTKSGDKAECGDVPETSPLWAQATSTRDNCLGQECPDHAECFVLAARKTALDAELIVVNHHLFFADVTLRDEGLAELLPACNTVIFDEAHQLPEVASLFFSESVSTAQIVELARDARAEAAIAARDFSELPAALRTLETAARDLRLAVGAEPGRFAAQKLENTAVFPESLARLRQRCQETAKLLETQAERSEGLERCWQRALELEERIARWQTPPEETEGDAARKIRWCEAFSQSLQLFATPLSVADIFLRQMESGPPRAWIFTSATLTVQGNFSHYQSELGLEKAETGCWESPFSYDRQALLYAPQGLPDPNAWGYMDAVVDAVWPVIQAAADSHGGAFFLCTSLKAMRRVHELLQQKIAENSQSSASPPLFLQGERGKNELLNHFRQAGNGILVGSQSFWEGVDVRGKALSLVVIDKLPFAPPDDPVLSARIAEMKKKGRRPFLEYQLPRAILQIKQGAGRLIRSESDRGILMICDPRMLGKPYGYRVWRSLPPMRRTREEREAVAFFRDP
ncbi:MAG: ATP-dependent DNA helicase [Zoogloeaceae bacterium]|nr:ATP-dependent DNA helicase [Zoogloeaceae bacterium]